MNARKYTIDLLESKEIQLISEPEEIWEALDPNDNVIGEIKTIWELYSYRAQIKMKKGIEGYKLRKKNNPSTIVNFDKRGRFMSRKDRKLFFDEITYFLNILIS